jgi:hypothetical protein
MEPRFGRDFSHVRIHRDAQAASSARAVDAHAYTVGRDIVFGRDQYAPETEFGRRLLAHELAHVVQRSPALRRWKISGSTATSDRDDDLLGGLAEKAGARAADWKCIRPIRQKTASHERLPADFDSRYERYVQQGDQFDVSNLIATTGRTVRIYLFDDANAAMDAAIAKHFYPRSEFSPGADGTIEDKANSGKEPIGDMVIFGHAAGDSMWGGSSNTFTPSQQDPEEPPQAFVLAEAGLFPRRCWFTRNATVRSVGCNSQAWGRDFAAHYLRRGASVTATTASVRPACSPPLVDRLGNCKTFDGLEFAASHLITAALLAGPFYDVASFHGARYWATTQGAL